MSYDLLRTLRRSAPPRTGPWPRGPECQTLGRMNPGSPSQSANPCTHRPATEATPVARRRHAPPNLHLVLGLRCSLLGIPSIPRTSVPHTPPEARRSLHGTSVRTKRPQLCGSAVPRTRGSETRHWSSASVRSWLLLTMRPSTRIALLRVLAICCCMLHRVSHDSYADRRIPPSARAARARRRLRRARVCIRWRARLQSRRGHEAADNCSRGGGPWI